MLQEYILLIYLSIYLPLYTCHGYMHMHVHVCICMYVYIYIYMYIYTYICMYLCMYVGMYVCMCLYIYIYIYMHTYIYIYIYTHTSLCIREETQLTKFKPQRACMSNPVFSSWSVFVNVSKPSLLHGILRRVPEPDCRSSVCTFILLDVKLATPTSQAEK